MRLLCSSTFKIYLASFLLCACFSSNAWTCASASTWALRQALVGEMAIPSYQGHGLPKNGQLIGTRTWAGQHMAGFVISSEIDNLGRVKILLQSISGSGRLLNMIATLDHGYVCAGVVNDRHGFTKDMEVSGVDTNGLVFSGQVLRVFSNDSVLLQIDSRNNQELNSPKYVVWPIGNNPANYSLNPLTLATTQE